MRVVSSHLISSHLISSSHLQHSSVSTVSTLQECWCKDGRPGRGCKGKGGWEPDVLAGRLRVCDQPLYTGDRMRPNLPRSLLEPSRRIHPTGRLLLGPCRRQQGHLPRSHLAQGVLAQGDGPPLSGQARRCTRCLLRRRQSRPPTRTIHPGRRKGTCCCC